MACNTIYASYEKDVAWVKKLEGGDQVMATMMLIL